MKFWTLNIFLESYKEIDQGIKSVEGRSPDPKNPEKNYRKIEAGDRVIIRPVEKDSAGKIRPISGIGDMEFIVAFNHRYKSTEDMLNGEGLQNLMPNAKSFEEAVKFYHSLPGHEERIKNYGTCAIGLETRVY